MHIWSSNFENFQPHRFAAPAACIKTFLNGVVSIRLPTRKSWIKAYSDDPKMLAISSLVMNPGMISQRSLKASKLKGLIKHILFGIVLFKLNICFFMYSQVPSIDSGPLTYLDRETKTLVGAKGSFLV
jgi:hypothetical protein